MACGNTSADSGEFELEGRGSDEGGERKAEEGFVKDKVCGESQRERNVIGL